MVFKLKYIFWIIKDIFWRKHIVNMNFISGTTTWKECLIILSYIVTRKNIVNGNSIIKYENEFRNYLGVKYAFSFGAGRMAFYAILKAMDIKEGDEVILSGYTCVVVPNAIIYCGAKPVYVDIDPNTLNIDVSKIEEKITSHTKIIYAQHTFGSFCDMVAIQRIAKQYNLKVVEDCAHSLGSEYKGKKAGNFGDAAYFTTEQSKIISTGMGGMAVTNNEQIATKIQETQMKSEFYDELTVKKIALQIVCYNLLYNPKMYFVGKYFLRKLNKLLFFIQSTTEEEMQGKKPTRYPVRLSNIQARVGLSQLKNINSNLKHRREIASYYRESIKELNYKIPECIDSSYKPSYIRYWFIVEDKEEMQEYFEKEEIELGEWFNSPLHPRGSALENLGYQKGSCPFSEYITTHNLNLPTHMKISEKYAKRIIRVLNKYES